MFARQNIKYMVENDEKKEPLESVGASSVTEEFIAGDVDLFQVQI